MIWGLTQIELTRLGKFPNVQVFGADLWKLELLVVGAQNPA